MKGKIAVLALIAMVLILGLTSSHMPWRLILSFSGEDHLDGDDNDDNKRQ